MTEDVRASVLTQDMIQNSQINDLYAVATRVPSLVLGEEMQPWKLIAFALVILGLCINLFGARLYVGLVGARQ